MIFKNINFFNNKNYFYLFLIIIITIIFFIILRIWLIKRIKDNVNIKQAPEIRDKIIILRDCYKVKLFKQIIEKSKIIIIGVHNLKGHKNDFELLSSFCKKNKISLISYNIRSINENLKKFKFKSLGTDINDLKDIINVIKYNYQNQKIVIFGESLGAAIASFAIKNNSKVSGLIISNLITKKTLYQFSFKFLIFCFFSFIFNSNIKIKIYIKNKDISNNNNYINKINQNYINNQNWSLRFLFQLKNINKRSLILIRKFKIPILILQSADDVFSDYHQLKINKKYWKTNHNYIFIPDGKHALINEPNIKNLFNNKIIPWIKENIK